MRTITLSMEDNIQGCFGSSIYLFFCLPNVCMPERVLFCERRNDIKVAMIGVLNIRFGLAFVTSVYTHNLTEFLGVGGEQCRVRYCRSILPLKIFHFPCEGTTSRT